MLRAFVCIAVALLVTSSNASAQQRGTVAVLIPGAGGARPADFLMRNQARFTQAGIETRVATSPGEAAAIVSTERQQGRKVVIVGMSRGAISAASAVASGAPASGVVFVSADLGTVTSQLGSPAKLPPTLVVHHRRDGCRMTSPEGVDPFVRWSGGKAQVRWIDTHGESEADPCRPFGAHGFYQQDGPAVSAIIGFIRSR